MECLFKYTSLHVKKNNKLKRTHFYDKVAWLLHLCYYILNVSFLENEIIKERNFGIQSKELIMPDFLLFWCGAVVRGCP